MHYFTHFSDFESMYCIILSSLNINLNASRSPSNPLYSLKVMTHLQANLAHTTTITFSKSICSISYVSCMTVSASPITLVLATIVEIIFHPKKEMLVKNQDQPNATLKPVTDTKSSFLSEALPSHTHIFNPSKI
jgi:hypothetical protein